ncbi:tetratricopeptide repeat protein [Empedobacter tilapiae]|uniref:Tetratricopeptide repeat protein n=1 Tax=Empedobacter tilapiae TaxID=2491114 RepID=A0A4Z1B5S2_9FLAO|nr:tetratricopeptide repeat protein [Empedobacter tilapiae]TGN29203.1 tetratricopeptide repeat protein [Empedobacter tilapiae]
MFLNQIYLQKLKLLFVLAFTLISVLLNAQKNAETEIENYLKKSYEFVSVNLDSALLYNRKADDLIHNLPKNADKISVYKNLGNIYLERGDFVNSLNYFLKASKIVENKLISEPNNQQYMTYEIELLIAVGNLELRQNNFDQTLGFYNRAKVRLEQIKNESKRLQFKLNILNNTAGVFLKKEEFNKALKYYELAQELNVKAKDEKLEASLLNNMGICYLENQEYVTSIFVLNKALEIRKKLDDQRGIAQCYNNLGKAYGLQKKYKESKYYLEEALKIGHNVGNTESILYSLFSLKRLYEELNDYENAFKTLDEYTTLNKKVYNEESVKKMAQLELNYKLDKQKTIYSENIKRQEAEKKRTKLIYYSIGSCLFLFLILAILWIYLQKTKIKNISLLKEKLQLEHKNISLEKDFLKDELEFKNREITAKIMYLFKKNELINSIAERLVELKKKVMPENKKEIQEMIVEMRLKKDDEIWTEFETYFTKVNPDFYTKLNELCPNLTPNEKKLCAFLRLKMTTKEIATITYQSTNSINVSRFRLRKKLNIKGEDINLINFLENL